jgi:hypothetical protein
LPDGIFSNQKSKFGYIWESVLQWKMLVNFMAIWSIVLLFGIFYGHFVYFVVILAYFYAFWYVVPRKIWQPC